MSTDIKVSIIVPVYKVPLEYLRECFDSLLTQTMQECEFIVVSDGAPEAECSICEEYTKRDSRFKFFKREHAGVSATRNYGIEQAQGEYITFVDSDDWVDKNSCTKAYEFAKENDSDIVLWEAKPTYAIHTSTLFSKNKALLSSLDIQNLCSNCIFTAHNKYYSVSLVCCKLFKREILISKGIRYSTDLHINEDRIFNITTFSKTQRISYFKDCLYNYRIHANSTSHKYIQNAYFVLTNFIHKLDSHQKNLFASEIFQEEIRVFFSSWSLCYMHSENNESLIQRCKKLSSIVKSKYFQNQLHKHSLKHFSFDVRIELFFFKHKLTFPIYINAIKSKIFKH